VGQGLIEYVIWGKKVCWKRQNTIILLYRHMGEGSKITQTTSYDVWMFPYQKSEVGAQLKNCKSASANCTTKIFNWYNASANCARKKKLEKRKLRNKKIKSIKRKWVTLLNEKFQEFAVLRIIVRCYGGSEGRFPCRCLCPVPTALGDSKFVDLLRTVSTCNSKINDACVSKIEYKI